MRLHPILIACLAGGALWSIPTFAAAACISDAECKGDRVCLHGSCSMAPTCAVDIDCPGDLVCESNVCRNMDVDGSPFQRVPAVQATPAVVRPAEPEAGPRYLQTSGQPAAIAEATAAASSYVIGSGAYVNLNSVFYGGTATVSVPGHASSSDLVWGGAFTGRLGYLSEGRNSISALIDFNLPEFGNEIISLGIGWGPSFSAFNSDPESSVLAEFVAGYAMNTDGTLVWLGADVIPIGVGAAFTMRLVVAEHYVSYIGGIGLGFGG